MPRILKKEHCGGQSDFLNASWLTLKGASLLITIIITIITNVALITCHSISPTWPLAVAVGEP